MIDNAKHITVINVIWYVQGEHVRIISASERRKVKGALTDHTIKVGDAMADNIPGHCKPIQRPTGFCYLGVDTESGESLAVFASHGGAV
jgi:hypothetical protein